MEIFKVKKIKMKQENSLSFEQGCDLYLNNCRERNENFDEAVNTPFYAFKTIAFKQVAVGTDEDVTTYTCAGAIAFAVIGGIDRLLLIALTAYSFILSKKAKDAAK